MMYNMLHKITTNSFRDLVRALEVHDALGPTKELLSENLTLHEQLEMERPENAPKVFRMLFKIFSKYFRIDAFEFLRIPFL